MTPETPDTPAPAQAPHLCVYCAHFVLQTSYDMYGDNFREEIRCGQLKPLPPSGWHAWRWEIDGKGNGEYVATEFRRCITLATTCPDFTHVPPEESDDAR